MASLRRTTSGSYTVCFRFDGRQFQRGLKTDDPAAAKAQLGKVEGRIYDLSVGRLSIPEGVETADFIVLGDDAVSRQKSRDRQQQEAVPTVGEAIKEYLKSQRNLKDDSTLRTECCHLNNFKNCLGKRMESAIQDLDNTLLNEILQQRLDKAKPTTVSKERQTIVQLCNWATRKYKLASSPAADIVKIPASGDRDEFKTRDDIEAIVKRGGVSDEDELALWGSLFLTQHEIAEVLTLVEQRARHDFIHPMFCIAAFTGMRRGEIVLRLQWRDVNFASNVITARSKKQKRQERETLRKIDMHSELVALLKEYQTQRPKGQHVICPIDTLAPLTVWQAHGYYKRTLQGTRWERTLPSGKKKVVIGFHTLRHSFASNLAAAGVDQRIIDQLMGHQTEAMRRRYRHLFPKDRQAAIECLSYGIAKL